MPLPDYIGGNIQANSGATGFTMTSWTGSPQDGDLILCPILFRNGESPTLPTGGNDWTLEETTPTASNGSTGSGAVAQMKLYSCIRKNGTDPSLVVTRGTGPDLLMYGFHVVRPPSGYRWEKVVSSAETDGSNSASHSHSAVDTGAYTDCLIAHYFGTGSSNGASVLDATDPSTDSGAGSTSYTGTMTADQWERRGNLGSTALLDGSLHMGLAVKSSAGSTGALTATLSTSRRAASIVSVWRLVPIGAVGASAGVATVAGVGASDWRASGAAAGVASVAGVSALYPAIDTLVDVFNTLDTTTKWDEYDPGGVLAVSGGQLTVQCTPDYPGLTSKDIFHAKGRTVYCQIKDIGSTNAGLDGREAGWMLHDSAANNQVGFVCNEDGALTAYYVTSGSGTYPTFVTFDPAGATAWLRIRDNGTTTYWEYAATFGGSWTTLYSRASQSWMSSVRAIIFAGHWNGGESPVRTAIFDNFNSDGNSFFDSVGSSSGVAAVAGVAAANVAAVGASAGVATVSGVGKSDHRGVGNASGAATVTGVSAAQAAAVGSSAGAASTSGVGAANAAATGASAGVASISGIGAADFRAVGASSGVATVNGVGASAGGNAVGSVAAGATVSGIAAADVRAVGASAGVAAVTGVGAAHTRGVGSSAGVATVSGVGAADARAVGNSAGQAVVSGVTSQGASAGASAGQATVSGVAAADVRAVSTIAGAASVSGVAAASASAVGAAAGIATVAGVARSDHRGVGASAGAASVAGAARSDARGVGSSNGAATVLGSGGAHVASVGSAQGVAVVSGVLRASFSSIGVVVAQASVAGVARSDWRTVGSAVGQATVIGVGQSQGLVAAHPIYWLGSA